MYTKWGYFVLTDFWSLTWTVCSDNTLYEKLCTEVGNTNTEDECDVN